MKRLSKLPGIPAPKTEKSADTQLQPWEDPARDKPKGWDAYERESTGTLPGLLAGGAAGGLGLLNQMNTPTAKSLQSAVTSGMKSIPGVVSPNVGSVAGEIARKYAPTDKTPVMELLKRLWRGKPELGTIAGEASDIAKHLQKSMQGLPAPTQPTALTEHLRQMRGATQAAAAPVKSWATGLKGLHKKLPSRLQTAGALVKRIPGADRIRKLVSRIPGKWGKALALGVGIPALGAGIGSLFGGGRKKKEQS